MPVPLQLLLLEDQLADAELVLHELRQAGFAPDWRRVETEADYLAALDPALDLILADYALPQFDALRALELLRARGLNIPFIVVSGTIGEDIAVVAIQRGAADYLLKDRLARLGTAVENALHQRRMQAENALHQRHLRAEQLRAEQLLRNSEQRFRALIEHAPDGITLVDASGKLQYVSPSTQRILGYSFDEVIGRDPSELTHPDDLPRLLGVLHDLMHQPGHTRIVQYRFRHKDGSWHWIESTISNLLAEPEVGAIVFNYRDISERMQAEQALRAAEAKYRILIEHVPAIVYQAALDATSSTLYVNEQIEQTLGFTQAEWLADPQRWLAQLHPHDLDQVLANVSRTQASGKPTRSEFRMLTRDGQVMWFADEAVVVCDAEQRPLFLQGIMLDITARKRAEDQIRQLNAELEQRVADRVADLARSNAELQAEIAERIQLEQHIQASADRATALAMLSQVLAESGHALTPLFQAIVEQMVQLLSDAAILTMLSDDQQLMQVMAIAHHHADGREAMQVLLPAAYHTTQGLAGRVAQTGQALLLPVVSLEAVRTQIKPEYQPYLDRFGMASLLVVPLRARGRILGTLGVSRDQPGRPYSADDQAFLQDLADRAGLAIENTQLFVAARLAREEADRANRAKSEFLTSMSHELRTPLNAILGFTGTLLMRLPGPLNPDQERQLTTVKTSAKHLLALINDILDLAKIEAGKVELRLVPVECQALLNEVAASLRPLALQKGLGFGLSMPDAPLTLVSDARVLSQILINLVNNAIKFTDHGEVQLRLYTEQREPRAAGAAGSTELWVCFSVSDTGIGIRAEDQSRLFTEFGRVASAAVREREGTGLGLRLSRKLAELLGGQIELASVFGQGSRFTLALPTT